MNQCPDCQCDLSEGEPLEHGHGQVFDIPAVRIEVTEHQVEIKACPCCHKRVEARYPEHVKQRMQYGPRFKAQASYLNTYQLVPIAHTCRFLQPHALHSLCWRSQPQRSRWQPRHT